ncbi:hypothetical protein GF345_00355 [Candidatus Woesearchaeota archaeon]|nr:hypothetical protein [Candidatus Woesearchaeota archaeon]
MFTKTNTDRVMDMFLQNPDTSFHLREIARLTGLSPAGVLKILRKLVKQDLVSKEKTRVTDNYLANTDNKEFVALKRASNIYSISSCGVIREIAEKYLPEAVVLFGSYARGEDTGRSDIDIAVITDKKKDINTAKYEKSLKRRINIHKIKLDKASKEFRNNLANGITLHGFLRLIK